MVLSNTVEQVEQQVASTQYTRVTGKKIIYYII